MQQFIYLFAKIVISLFSEVPGVTNHTFFSPWDFCAMEGDEDNRYLLSINLINHSSRFKPRQPYNRSWSENAQAAQAGSL